MECWEGWMDDALLIEQELARSVLPKWRLMIQKKRQVREQKRIEQEEKRKREEEISSLKGMVDDILKSGNEIFDSKEQNNTANGLEPGSTVIHETDDFFDSALKPELLPQNVNCANNLKSCATIGSPSDCTELRSDAFSPSFSSVPSESITKIRQPQAEECKSKTKQKASFSLIGTKKKPTNEYSNSQQKGSFKSSSGVARRNTSKSSHFNALVSLIKQ
eukprot:MONOS_9038.1-p1 / transcript=MONOS_9038.1 / gene=MONOS_9038 / organism=Monocercomonoides_exilis_PA203 / gene_product=unspecified product / transcript_product=unspecified product / location=Mono_scaffold00359:30135-30791(-) / protein_length=219 / sequence_SO=supercontig / SO=protein_coding / is_pseudo=false